MNKNETALMFSGGTDSTLAAALDAQKFEKVHLITYDRFGFFSMKNSEVNVNKLKNKFGEGKFDHHVIDIDRLTRYIFYERYIINLRRHGFFLLSTCGLCKLAMHVRTLVFCLDNKIGNVSDGANQGMDIFPAQMVSGIKELQEMYGRFNIKYNNPVFEFDGPQDTGFADRLHFDRVLEEKQEGEETVSENKNTAGACLCKLGLMPSNNVKGTALDRKMQGRCFQFILLNIFVKWYYLHDHTYEQYVAANVKLYKDKKARLMQMVDEYLEQRNNSRIYKLISNKKENIL